MKDFLLRIEPLIWLLFGQGMLIGTILLGGWVLVVGIAAPVGLVGSEALGFPRAHMLASNLIGRLVLAGVIILPLWRGVHTLRAVLVDFNGGDRDVVVAPLLYGIATLGSLAGLMAVIRL